MLSLILSLPSYVSLLSIVLLNYKNKLNNCQVKILFDKKTPQTRGVSKGLEGNRDTSYFDIFFYCFFSSEMRES